MRRTAKRKRPRKRHCGAFRNGGPSWDRTRDLMLERFNGEYDGWEAQIQSPT